MFEFSLGCHPSTQRYFLYRTSLDYINLMKVLKLSDQQIRGSSEKYLFRDCAPSMLRLATHSPGG